MILNQKPLKAQTAKELEEIQTPNGVRKRILEASFHDPLIRRVLDIARIEGWSGEDTFALLAYHALVAKQELEERAPDDLMTRPRQP